MKKNVNHQGQLDEIQVKLEDGDISTAEALRETNRITVEMATANALKLADQRTREIMSQKDAEAAENKWHQDFPDYQEVVDSGILEEYMAMWRAFYQL